MKDTSPAAERIVSERVRSMSPEERIRQALEFSESLRNFAFSRLRSSRPRLTDLEAAEALLGRTLIPADHPARR